MKTNYFKDCKSKEDAKKLYKKLAFKHHPDKGGDVEIMKAINNEFDEFIKNFKDNKKDSKKEYEFKSSTYRNLIEKLIKFDNITIDIVGYFIWITGNTYPIKEELKQLGFKYSRNKKSWYTAPKEYMENRTNYKKRYSMNEIKNKYGCTSIKSEGGYKKENTKMIG
ncbi:MAG: molecular chaperone DnaJ [Clostridia bacterium]